MLDQGALLSPTAITSFSFIQPRTAQSTIHAPIAPQSHEGRSHCERDVIHPRKRGALHRFMQVPTGHD